MTGLEELDEKDIEETIRRELEELDLKDVESSPKCENIQTDYFDANSKLSSEEKYGVPPDSVEKFIRLLQSRNDKLEEKLAEAQDALKFANQHDSSIAVEDADEEAKISPERREKILLEIEELESSDKAADVCEDILLDLKEEALKSMTELESRQHQKSNQLNSLFNEIKENETSRYEIEKKMREDNMRKATEEHKIKMHVNQSVKMKIETEARLQQQKFQDLQKQFESEMKDLERMQEKEKVALARLQSDELRKRAVQREVACIMIQKNYRKFRVQLKYGDILKTERDERQKKRQEELNALEHKEKRLIEEAIQRAKEEELRRLKQIEIERQRRAEEERKRQEDERKRLEELRMKEVMEKKRKEEERLENERQEKQERERKIEEERKKQEEEERRLREERKRLEEEKLEMKRRKEEEQERKLQEKMKKQEEEKRKLIEEAERKKVFEDTQRKLEADQLKGQTLLEGKTTFEEENLMEQMKQVEEIKLQEKRNLERQMDQQEELVEVKIQQEIDNDELEKEREIKLNENDGLVLSDQTIKKELMQDRFAEKVDVSMVGKQDDEYTNDLESLREEWLKRTTMWSSMCVDQNTNAKSRSRPRRPLSASQKLQSISEEELLTFLNKATSLDKVKSRLY